MLQYIRIESFQRSLFIDVPIFRINYFYKIRLFSSESTALKSIVQQRGVRLIFVQGCQRECGGRSDLKRQSSSSRYISKFGKAVTSAVLREKKNKSTKEISCACLVTFPWWWPTALNSVWNPTSLLMCYTLNAKISIFFNTEELKQNTPDSGQSSSPIPYILHWNLVFSYKCLGYSLCVSFFCSLMSWINLKLPIN